MSLSAKDVANLKKLIHLAQNLLSEAEGASKSPKGAKHASQERPLRRSGKVLIAFRKMLKAERKKRVPVAELAKRHGISTVYIYKLG
jgi:hypothetical protein